MAIGHKIESHRFWDIATLWAKERLEHEDIVARGLASAIINEGLLLHSTDPKWLKGDDGNFQLRGTPYVGYSPTGAGEIMVLRAEALEHLMRVVRSAKTPSKSILKNEFIFRSDFARWLIWSGEKCPMFWFPEGTERISV